MPAQLCVAFFFHRFKKKCNFFFVFIFRIGIVVLKLWMYLLFFKNVICMWFGIVLILILISVFISKMPCVCVCFQVTFLPEKERKQLVGSHCSLCVTL